MNFTDIVTQVLAKVKRPDKLDLIRAQVNAAILFFSTEHDYDADILEQQVPVTPPALQSYDFIIPVSSLPRFRKMDYVRIAGSRHYAEKLDTRKLDKCTDLRNKWYRAGPVINVQFSAQAALLDISYFQYPPILTDASPEFWMLEGNWSAVAEYAASVVFNDIGDAQSSATALRKAMLEASIFKSDYIRSSQ